MCVYQNRKKIKYNSDSDDIKVIKITEWNVCDNHDDDNDNKINGMENKNNDEFKNDKW